MNCPLCGTKIARKQVICPHCGTDVASMSAPPPVNSTATLHVKYYRLPLPPITKSKTRTYIIAAIACLLLLSCIGSSAAYIINRYTIASDPYPPYSNALLFNESLASADSTNFWPVTSSHTGKCAFIDGAYHVQVTQPAHLQGCASHYADLFDFIYEVHMTIIHGNCGGIVFRVNFQVGGYYYYEICRQNTYSLSFIDAPFSPDTTALTPAQIHLLASGIDAGLHAESGASILVAVVGINTTFDLYLNHQKVKTVTSNMNSYGGIGVATYEPGSADLSQVPSEVAFSNVRVWVVQNH